MAELINNQGQRLYLVEEERLRFFEAAMSAPDPKVRTLCLFMCTIGCRISEALAIRVASIDVTARYATIRSLKKRDEIHFRLIPLPARLLADLDAVHGLSRRSKRSNWRLWPWSRTTAYRRVKEVFARAGISGAHATPKGLRHGFGAACVMHSVGLPTIQKSLGHSQIETTAIYTGVMGNEERELLGRTWEKLMNLYPKHCNKLEGEYGRS